MLTSFPTFNLCLCSHLNIFFWCRPLLSRIYDTKAKAVEKLGNFKEDRVSINHLASLLETPNSCSLYGVLSSVWFSFHSSSAAGLASASLPRLPLLSLSDLPVATLHFLQFLEVTSWPRWCHTCCSFWNTGLPSADHTLKQFPQRGLWWPVCLNSMPFMLSSLWYLFLKLVTVWMIQIVMLPVYVFVCFFDICSLYPVSSTLSCNSICK